MNIRALGISLLIVGIVYLLISLNKRFRLFPDPINAYVSGGLIGIGSALIFTAWLMSKLTI